MKNHYRLIVFFIMISLLLQGCGYRFGLGDLPSRYHTLEVPFVKGDVYGELTNALIREVSISGAFRYKRSGGDIVLQVSILDLYEDDVGFRYDRHKDGRREKNTIPTETRMTAVCEVVVVESSSGAILFGPEKIQMSVDFDHNYYFGSDKLNRISLGQVTDIDDARDSVQSPLFIALAEKIVNTIINGWS